MIIIKYYINKGTPWDRKNINPDKNTYEICNFKTHKRSGIQPKEVRPVMSLKAA